MKWLKSANVHRLWQSDGKNGCDRVHLVPFKGIVSPFKGRAPGRLTSLPFAAGVAAAASPNSLQRHPRRPGGGNGGRAPCQGELSGYLEKTGKKPT